jgi:hypothetical protein
MVIPIESKQNTCLIVFKDKSSLSVFGYWQTSIYADPSVRPLNGSHSKQENEDAVSLQFDNRQFTYKELKTITNSFEKSIGKGGFGVVYLGYLEDGTPVAVKTRTESSSQSHNEFLGEVRFLPVHFLPFLYLFSFLCTPSDP